MLITEIRFVSLSFPTSVLPRLNTTLVFIPSACSTPALLLCIENSLDNDFVHFFKDLLTFMMLLQIIYERAMRSVHISVSRFSHSMVFVFL